MKKMLIGGTLILTLGMLILGITNPAHPLMWLASTSQGYELTRAGLVVLLAALLFSNPPRAVYFRVILGVVAAGLAVSTVALLLSYEMNLLDAIVFSEVAIIFAIEALESTENYPVTTKKSKRPTAALG